MKCTWMWWVVGASACTLVAACGQTTTNTTIMTAAAVNAAQARSADTQASLSATIQVAVPTIRDIPTEIPVTAATKSAMTTTATPGATAVVPSTTPTLSTVVAQPTSVMGSATPGAVIPVAGAMVADVDTAAAAETAGTPEAAPVAPTGKPGKAATPSPTVPPATPHASPSAAQTRSRALASAITTQPKHEATPTVANNHVAAPTSTAVNTVSEARAGRATSSGVASPGAFWVALEPVVGSAAPGDTVAVVGRSEANVPCTLSVTVASGSAVKMTDAQKQTDTQGLVAWTWAVPPTLAPEKATVAVRCSRAGYEAQQYRVVQIK